VLTAIAIPAFGSAIEFAGYRWEVRAGQGGPGPNAWDARNVWLDAATNLHLKISCREAQWTYAPVEPEKRIAAKPMPAHINLWLFQGRPPKDGQEVEVVIRGFEYAAPSLPQSR